MVRYFLCSSWNHLKLCRSHHRYSYTGGILPRRSSDRVRFGALFHNFTMFILFIYVKMLDERNASLAKRIEAMLFFGHPFFPALLNVVTLISYLKKLWRSKQIQPVRSETTDEEKEHLVLLKTSNFFLLFEAFFESAPQFIIQL